MIQWKKFIFIFPFKFESLKKFIKQTVCLQIRHNREIKIELKKHD